MSWDVYCIDGDTIRSYAHLQLITPVDPRLLGYPLGNELLEPAATVAMKDEGDKTKSGAKTAKAGRPLAMTDRYRILALYERGHKISHIARMIGVTHSCVSKIMSRYRRTGSMCPRSTRTEYKRDSESSSSSSDAASQTSASEVEDTKVPRAQALPYSIERLLA